MVKFNVLAVEEDKLSSGRQKWEKSGSPTVGMQRLFSGLAARHNYLLLTGHLVT